jgi:heme/copper-type cytochrome/quinol oxidase subunit 2
MDFIQILTNNALPIFIVAVLGFIAWQFFHFISKSVTKPISREEIERKRFIERMKINTNQYPFKWLYRGNDRIGEIVYSKGSQITGNPHNHILIEMVVKPTLFWKIPNPLSHDMAIQVNYGSFNDKKELEKLCIEDGDRLILPSWIHFDYFFGIYYDNSIQEEHHEIILKQNLAYTDLNNEKSVDFARAQEMATIGYMPYAHEMGMEEKRKQTELERKKGKVETI